MFEVKNETDAVEVTCIANHTDGFSKGSSFRAPIDPESFMNRPQRYASALTFAKRYAFCDIFGIMTGDEDDDSQAVTETDNEDKTSAMVIKAINISTLENLEDFKKKLEKSDKYSANQKKMFAGAIESRVKILKEAKSEKETAETAK
jgi:LDH2 family malate/lactate/ureidoglycolate dehydrogenase